MSWIIAKDEKNGLLDTFSGAAAAYSLRNLQGRSGKDSAIVRVRRSSDNTESDFTATEVSDGTLAAWVGAGNDGFVRTWYDQSGNGRDAQQATAASQPSIVSSGSVVTDGLKPALSFNSDFLKTSPFGGWDSDSLFLVFSCTALNQFVVDGDTANNISLWTTTTAGSLRYAVGLFPQLSNIYTLGSRALVTGIALSTNPTSSTVKVNGDQRTLNVGTNKRNGLTFGGSGDTPPALLLTGKISEAIIYPADKSSEQNAIEANINAHYSIY
jgi:hypothetical protein